MEPARLLKRSWWPSLHSCSLGTLFLVNTVDKVPHRVLASCWGLSWSPLGRWGPCACLCAHRLRSFPISGSISKDAITKELRTRVHWRLKSRLPEFSCVFSILLLSHTHNFVVFFCEWRVWVLQDLSFLFSLFMLHEETRPSFPPPYLFCSRDTWMFGYV